MSERIVRIGGACGAYGDSVLAVPQLLTVASLDYLLLDYLSEPVMGAFAKLAEGEPEAGFPPDFLNVHIGPYLEVLAARRIKVVSNAGALRPRALAKALERLAGEKGLALKVAAIDGDDLRSRLPHWDRSSIREMFSGGELPERAVTSCNAYLGAFPIAAALARGADIVVTGRVVDSALALGPLIHEFGWRATDYDLLAAGTMAGHLLECGAQVTGGTFTDWREVPDWANIGFPIGECRRDGRVVITKPPGTGGLVSVGTVAEQLLYEVSDPQAYIVPDVVCDFSNVTLSEAGADRIAVFGAKGYPPTSTYKVCLSYDAGWRAVAYLPIISTEAVAKAERQAAAILGRLDGMLRAHNLGHWTKTYVEVLGGEANFGSHARARGAREVMLRLVVEHEEKQAVDLFAREAPCSIMAMAAGSTVGFVQTNPVSRLFMFLHPKAEVDATLTMEGTSRVVKVPTEGGFHSDMIKRPQPKMQEIADATQTVPLVQLAWARSGDKGDLFNVAVISRRSEYLPYIRAALSCERVAGWYGHLFHDGARRRVERFEAPALSALNFVVHEALDGGSTASARLDFVAKGMAQQLLEFPVPVPEALAVESARKALPRDARPYVGPA